MTISKGEIPFCGGGGGGRKILETRETERNRLDDYELLDGGAGGRGPGEGEGSSGKTKKKKGREKFSKVTRSSRVLAFVRSLCLRNVN